jgi:hypothetical protein
MKKLKIILKLIFNCTGYLIMIEKHKKLHDGDTDVTISYWNEGCSVGAVEMIVRHYEEKIKEENIQSSALDEALQILKKF